MQYLVSCGSRARMIKPIKPPERTFGFGGLIMNKEFKSKCLFFLMVQDLNSCFMVLTNRNPVWFGDFYLSILMFGNW